MREGGSAAAWGRQGLGLMDNKAQFLRMARKVAVPTLPKSGRGKHQRRREGAARPQAPLPLFA